MCQVHDRRAGASLIDTIQDGQGELQALWIAAKSTAQPCATMPRSCSTGCAACACGETGPLPGSSANVLHRSERTKHHDAFLRGRQADHDYLTATEAEAERAKALAAGHGPYVLPPFTRPSLIAIHL